MTNEIKSDLIIDEFNLIHKNKLHEPIEGEIVQQKMLSKVYKILFFSILTFLFDYQIIEAQSLQIDDLFSLIQCDNIDQANTKMLQKNNWQFYQSDKETSVNYGLIEWTYNFHNWDDKAEGWLKLLYSGVTPVKVVYLISNKTAYINIKNILPGLGFKLDSTSIDNDEIISCYSNSKYYLSTSNVSSSEDFQTTSIYYVITVRKRGGMTDPNNGKKTTYFADGSISEEFTLTDGKLNGLYKSYSINGDLEVEINYLNGFKNGKLVQYYTDGKISNTCQYKLDSLDGPYKSFFNNGKLKIEGVFIDNEKEGEWKQYDIYGNVIYNQMYHDDILNGKYYESDSLNENTNEKVFGSYLNGEPNGYWKYDFYANDELYRESYTNYSNGIKNGNFKNYIGDTLRTGQYLNGNLYGVIVDSLVTPGYDLNGNFTGNIKFLNSEKTYNNGILEGESKFYLYNNLFFSGQYHNGLKEGKWVIFIPTFQKYFGEILRTENYHYGIINGQVESFYDFVQDTIDNHIHENYIKSYSKCNYKNGKLDGPCIKLDSVGILIYKGNFVKDKKDGEWIFQVFQSSTNDSSKIKYSSGKFIDDKKEGLWKNFFDSTDIISTSYYKSDKLNGVRTYFYKNFGEEKYLYTNDNLDEIIFNLLFDSNDTIKILKPLNSSSKSMFVRRSTLIEGKVVQKDFECFKDSSLEFNENYFDHFLQFNNSDSDFSLLIIPNGVYKVFDNKYCYVDGTLNKYIFEGKEYKYFNDYRVFEVKTYLYGNLIDETFFDYNTKIHLNGKFVLTNIDGTPYGIFHIKDGELNGSCVTYTVLGENKSNYKMGIKIK